jgi:hypothetical protein
MKFSLVELVGQSSVDGGGYKFKVTRKRRYIRQFGIDVNGCKNICYLCVLSKCNQLLISFINIK